MAGVRTERDGNAGLTTTKAPFIEQAQSEGRLYIHQPYELYTEANHEAWRRLFTRQRDRWGRYANARFLQGIDNLCLNPDRVPKLSRKHARFAVEFRKSKIHRWGMFACEEIPAKRRVIEYTGEKISAREVVRRSMRPHVYHFWLSGSTALDGAVKGSGAEFINHSCEPNLVARISKGRIWLVSLRRIAEGEELSFDYRMAGGQMLPCKCGAKSCRGYLNPIIMDS